MDLHVILGPAGAGKAGRAVAVLREAAATGVDAFMCVPGGVDRARFLRELGGGSGDVLFGVEVGTFDQLLARVAGSPPVRRTDRAMERIIVRDALRAVPAFAPAARWSGFVETARHHVDRLRRARVWGGVELERAEAELPGQDIEHWRQLEHAVGELLTQRRLRDDAWFERRAAEGLRSGRLGLGALVVYGFETLPPARILLLERLAEQIPVTVALAWRPGRRVHERAADLRDRWRARGAFIEELAAPSDGDPVLEWLGSELFEETAASPPLPVRQPDVAAPVAFVDCCGPLQEAQEVAREIALLASRGYAWDDIAVASTNAAVDGELVLAECVRAGIPARLQARRMAVDVPAGRALHELLDAVVARDALRLVAAVRASLFDLDHAALDAAELQLRGTRHARSTPREDAMLRRVVPTAIAGLWSAHAAADAAVPAMRELLRTLLPSDLGELDLLRGVAGMLEGLVVAAGGEPGVTLEDVRDAVAAFPLVTPDRSDSGTVVIASLEDLRSVAYDAIVLRGMHLAGFRARVDDDADAPAASRDLLHLAVTRARRTLRVVRQSAGSDGGHLAPSPAWSELRRLQAHAPLRTRRLGDVVVAPADVRLASEQDTAVAMARARGFSVDGVDRATDGRINQHRRVGREPVVRGTASEERAAMMSASVTSIERYATCSAKWFIERELRVSDPDEDRSRLVEGDLAHRLLQELVPDARTGRRAPDQTRADAAVLAPELAAKVDAHGVLDRARIERIREHVLTLIEAESEWEAPDSVEVERSFGRGAPNSIAPGYDADGVEIVGRVDRIDSYGPNLLLHDYKYGSTDRPAKDLIERRNIQLLVYWLALQQPGVGNEPIGAMYRAVTNGGLPSGVFAPELKTLGIIPPRTRAGVLGQEERESLLEQTRQLVHEAVDGMRAGAVSPLPTAAQCPSHCQLQVICRVGEGSNE